MNEETDPEITATIEDLDYALNLLGECHKILDSME
jgi:hypothetical protein